MRSKFSVIIGFILIAIGVFILGVVSYRLLFTKSTYNKYVEGSKVIKATSDNTVKDETIQNDIVTDTIEITEDQALDEISTYSNVIEFPNTDIRAYVFEGISASNLDKGVAHYEGTAPLGSNGNCAIAGHSSDLYSCIFNKLHDMVLLDEIDAYDNDGILHKYYITKKYIVDPNDVSCLEPNLDNVGTLTLTTCNAGANTRLIVTAKEFDDEQYLHFQESLVTDKLTSMSNINNFMDIQVSSEVQDWGKSHHHFNWNIKPIEVESSISSIRAVYSK